MDGILESLRKEGQGREGKWERREERSRVSCIANCELRIVYRVCCIGIDVVVAYEVEYEVEVAYEYKYESGVQYQSNRVGVTE